MDGAILEAASAAWAAISAVAVLLLGLLAFTGGRSRSPGSVALGGFACTWALHVIAGQAMAYASASFATTAHLAYFAFLLPLPYFLVQFARGFAREGARGGLWRAATIASVIAPLAAAGALVVAPELIYRGPIPFNGRIFPAWGPLFAPLAMIPFFLALGLALFALDASRRAATTARTSMGHALLAAGLGTFTAFSAANNLSFYAADAIALDMLALGDAYLVLFVALSAMALVVALRAIADARAAPSPDLRRPALLVALAILVPFVWGFAEGVIAYFLLPRFNTVGLWRLLGVGLLVYALARTRMPELTPRSRDAAATALGVGAAATTGGLAVGAFTLLAPGIPLLLLAGAAIPLATLSPSVRLARRALRVGATPDTGDATLARRLDAYRGALETSLARGTLGDDAPFLAGLRARLGIGEDVHDALLCIARTSALPPPDAAHPGYERLRLLGEGAQGRAWLTRRRSDDALVVLKEPPVASVAASVALRREAKLLLSVRHRNLARVDALVEGPRGPCLVMEYVPGVSLAERLATGPLAPAHAARHVEEVLAGLAALHAAGIVHGDVKPANVLLADDGRAKLADFGLARAWSVDATRTLVGMEGTLSALAPEQLSGAAATPASDVYAAGALLFRLLTGEHYVPLAGLAETDAKERVRARAPSLPHALVPPALAAVVQRALEKDPARRFPSASAMREALLSYA